MNFREFTGIEPKMLCYSAVLQAITANIMENQSRRNLIVEKALMLKTVLELAVRQRDLPGGHYQIVVTVGSGFTIILTGFPSLDLSGIRAISRALSHIGYP